MSQIRVHWQKKSRGGHTGCLVLLLLFALSSTLLGCGQGRGGRQPVREQQQSQAQQAAQEQVVPVQSAFPHKTPGLILYNPEYAQNFYLALEDGRKVLYLHDPASDKTFRHEIGTVKRVVCLSTTHLAFIHAIGASASVCGVSGARYIYNPRLRQCTDVGYESSINYETLLKLAPDVVFAYSIHGKTADYITKMEQLGLNVIQIPEHTERHPLGKAEFLVAFAAFYGLEDQARQKFCEIRDAYLKYKSLATGQKKEKVLINAPFNDIWYLPGSESHQNIFIGDAGGVLLGTCPGVNSSTISTEQAYLYALEADVWLNPNHYTQLAELENLDNRFARVPCFRNGNVWNNNLRSTPEGGSDYYESGAISPHLILADLIAILHPSLLPSHTFTYYRQLSRSQAAPQHP
ncbi:MAG TPA: ABC transporter substrate-binding protein [Bacteroidales bacterium]|nr:ABC transporter substrate-binding protein [Bacteroidales bacterium]